MASKVFDINNKSAFLYLLGFFIFSIALISEAEEASGDVPAPMLDSQLFRSSLDNTTNILPNQNSSLVTSELTEATTNQSTTTNKFTTNQSSTFEEQTTFDQSTKSEPMTKSDYVTSTITQTLMTSSLKTTNKRTTEARVTSKGDNKYEKQKLELMTKLNGFKIATFCLAGILAILFLVILVYFSAKSKTGRGDITTDHPASTPPEEYESTPKNEKPKVVRLSSYFPYADHTTTGATKGDPNENWDFGEGKVSTFLTKKKKSFGEASGSQDQILHTSEL